MPSSTSTCSNIVGLGNPLLDICSNVESEFLAKYDLKLDNAILAEDKHLKLYDEMMQQADVELVAGGATQNSIRVAQWMLQNSYPSVTSFLGCVGNDAYGQKLQDCATKDGVDVHYMQDTDTPTGTCAVLVKDGERSLVANLAAANKFQVEHLANDKSQSLVQKGGIFYSAGFHLTVCPAAMEQLGQHCVDNNKTFCINLSAPFIMQFFQDPLHQLLPFCDFVFGNETEAAEFGKMQNWGDDLQVIAQKLASLPKASGARARTVVFTQGKKDTIVFANGELMTFAVPTIADDEIVDTNGAGDAFVGGFLAQFALNQPLGKCVEAGHWASGVIIRRSGCTFPDTCSFNA